LTVLNEQALRADLKSHLVNIYPDHHLELISRIVPLIQRYSLHIDHIYNERWNEQDVILICYGDSIIEKDEKPLQALYRFLNTYLPETFNTVHILPFFPYSSDDGFSIIDYRVVNPELGDWDDIRRIASRFNLMMDLVINHVSRESLWFCDFVANTPPARDFFIDLPADTDISMVTRPRNSPLLVPVNTHRGIRHVWATFSENQIDLNFANPDVLIELIDIFLYYISTGAKIIRLDAIAFLWKQLGTNCIHLS